ncbi:MAG TPA: crosslink repair DNA glycosylase YcaQ family protein, partial [Devosia sp.]|nr:crosslink repair DNA glycosylase YcaQ family protein [Devosia sp.]
PPIQRGDLVLRYLRAFGPASAADMQAWSGMTRLGETFAGVRERLIGFVDEAGRELFDVPDAPRPDADVPAPVRFLGDFDNVVLGFAERSRIVSAESQKALVAATRSYRAVLVDGVVGGSWSLARSKGAATLTVTPFALLSRRDRRDVEAEGTAFLRFMAEGTPIQEVIVAAP